MPPDQASLEGLFIGACQAELAALKPGNVHIHNANHRMTMDDFERSARVAAPHIAKLGAPIGSRIEAAMRATWDEVGKNTNLGILLLSAPLLAAAEIGGDLRGALAGVLMGLTIEDTKATYRAIALANPAGLGEVSDQDVRAEPTLRLIDAMALAADRDLIARQYVTNYALVFDRGVVHLAGMEARGWSEDWAIASCFLDFLGAEPDTHIQRKLGRLIAGRVQRAAASLSRKLIQADDPASLKDELLDVDNTLKNMNINPGTSADMTVASFLASRIPRVILGTG